MAFDRWFSINAIAAGLKRQTAGLLQTKKQKRIAGIARKARKKAAKHRYDWIDTDWK